MLEYLWQEFNLSIIYRVSFSLVSNRFLSCLFMTSSSVGSWEAHKTNDLQGTGCIITDAWTICAGSCLFSVKASLTWIHLSWASSSLSINLSTRLLLWSVETGTCRHWSHQLYVGKGGRRNRSKFRKLNWSLFKTFYMYV